MLTKLTKILNNIMTTSNYIYLIQVREFIKTKENIYKVGMTTKENHIRFNQYPNGSILLFQMICNNCKNLEKTVIKIFKETFIQQKNIGTEYFEGDYKKMIDVIYLQIKNEEEILILNDNEEEILNDNEEYVYQITTYDEWIKYNKIDKIIITNKKTEEGFLRFKGYAWRKFYNQNCLEDDDKENLLGFIKNCQAIVFTYKNKITNEKLSNIEYIKLDNNERNKYTIFQGEYNEEQILKDIKLKCYVKKYDVYNLNYCEYMFYGGDCMVIYNSVNCTFTPVDELIDNKIITYNVNGSRIIPTKKIINIDIVNDILNSLIQPKIKEQYKKLVYNLLVNQEERQIIFYDYNDCLLTEWIRDLLYSLSGYDKRLYVSSIEYYDDKNGFKKLLKTSVYRCVIIHSHKFVSIQKQIDDFSKLGFRNIIVCQKDKANDMYNIKNFRNHLQINKEILMKHIKDESNITQKETQLNWDKVLQHDDNIFYSQRLLIVNFLKWCCVK
jgi:hypothetical protein